MYLNHVYGEGIYQFVREQDRGMWLRISGHERVLSQFDVLGAIVQRGGEHGVLLFDAGAYLVGKRAASRPLLYDDKRCGTFEQFPVLQQLTRHAMREERRDIATGIVVALPSHARRAGHIVAIARFIERHTHIVGKGDWPLAPDTLDNHALQGRRHICSNPVGTRSPVLSAQRIMLRWEICRSLR